MRPGRLALCELAALVLLLVVAHLAAGEGLGSSQRADRQVDARRSLYGGHSRTPNPKSSPAARCPAAQNAIGHYRRAYTASRSTMGLDGAPPRAWYPCAAARRRAAQWRDRAKQARLELARWTRDNYHWWLWLPSNWAALGACETGYGKRPGNWAHDSGQYVSAFGIQRHNYMLDAHRIGNLSWDETKARLGRLPTPREQYGAAVSHLNTYGDGWGCPGP